MGSNDFNPDWTCHPGELLEQVMEDKELTKETVAERMGASLDVLQDILLGCSIDKRIASMLEKAIGAPAAFWLRCEASYKRDILRLVPGDQKVFKKLRGFLVIRGSKAAEFKEAFIQNVVVNDPDHGYEKAAALKEAEDYTILMELHSGKWHYQVAIGASCGTYVAIGPNVVIRLATHALDTKPSPVVDMAKSFPVEYSYAGAH